MRLSGKNLVIVSSKSRPGETITLDMVKQFLADNKTNADVQKVVLELVPVNEERVRAYFSTDDGKVVSKKIFDQRVTDAVKTFETNFKTEKLPGLVETRYKELHPDETPESKANRELAEKVKSLEEENKRSKLRARALELITENKLPFHKVIDKLIGNDEEETAQNIEAFNSIWQETVTGEVTERLKDNSGRPGAGGGSTTKESKLDELQKQMTEAKKSGNLTEQVRLKNLIFEQQQAQKSNNQK